jgi:hypothetical protein
MFKILSTYICWKNIYIMQYLEVSGTPVLYTVCPKKIVSFSIFFFLGAQCEEWCKLHWLLLDFIEIPAVPVGTKFPRWRPPNNRRHFVLWNTKGTIFFGHSVYDARFLKVKSFTGIMGEKERCYSKPCYSLLTWKWRIRDRLLDSDDNASLVKWSLLFCAAVSNNNLALYSDTSANEWPC